MSDSDRTTPRRPDPDDVALIEEIQSLQGEEMPIDQDAVLEPGEFEGRREPTLTELDRGEEFPDGDGDGLATLDGLADEELREGETDDPDVATEEGLTYLPPSDPPLNTDAQPDELLPDEDELTARVREALRADAATTGYADRLVIETDDTTAIIWGTVDDVDDSDTIAEVIERVDGIDTVIDETELAEADA